MNTEIIPAGENEIPAILEMMEVFNAIDHYPYNASLAEKNLKKFVNSPELGKLWLVQCENEVVGYVALTFGFSFEHGGRDAFIDELFLQDSHRGKGVGSEVLKQVLEAAGALEVATIHLEVEKHNEAGKKIYEKFGFRESNRILMNYPVKN